MSSQNLTGKTRKPKMETKTAAENTVDSTTTAKIPPPSFYAVRSGRVSGIFKTLDECINQVIQFRGAEFGKFDNLQEADKYLADYCQLYTCLPHHPDLTVVQVMGRETEYGKFVGVGCFNNTLCAVLTDSDTKAAQVEAVYKIIEASPDDGTQREIMIGSINFKSAPGSSNPDTIAEADNYLVDILDEKKSAAVVELTPDIERLIELNKKRKTPFKFASSDPINNLYPVRAATYRAGMAILTGERAKRQEEELKKKNSIEIKQL